MAEAMPGNTRQSRPHDPVFLVAKSGGSGVAVKALELLGRDASGARQCCLPRLFRRRTTSSRPPALSAARWSFSGRRWTFSSSGSERVIRNSDRKRDRRRRVWSAFVCPQQEET